MLICVQFSEVANSLSWQYEEALKGYDVPRANPDEMGDPGIRAKIFVTHEKIDGKLSTPKEIETIEGNLHCKETEAEKVFKTVKSFYSQQMKSSETRVEAQLGTKVKVNVKASYGGVGGSIGYTAPPLFGRSDTSSNRDIMVKQYVVDQRGGFTINTRKCLRITHSIFRSNLPRFNKHFLSMVSELSEKVHSTEVGQVYRRFVESFGTHYSQTTHMGAVYKAYTFFSESDRKSMSFSDMKKASQDTTSVGLGIFASGSKSNSKSSANKVRNTLHTSNKSFSALYVTQGTVLTRNRDKWNKESKNASYPFGRVLMPMHLLFEPRPFKKLKKEAKAAGFTIHATGDELQLFFVVQYRRYCLLFKVSLYQLHFVPSVSNEFCEKKTALQATTTDRKVIAQLHSEGVVSHRQH